MTDGSRDGIAIRLPCCASLHKECAVRGLTPVACNKFEKPTAEEFAAEEKVMQDAMDRIIGPPQQQKILGRAQHLIADQQRRHCQAEISKGCIDAIRQTADALDYPESALDYILLAKQGLERAEAAFRLMHPDCDEPMQPAELPLPTDAELREAGFER